jgi:hypothetical protein
MPERPPLHELSTQILDRNAVPSRPGLHEAQTQLKPLPDLHVQPTQILSLPTRPEPQMPERAPLSELQTKIIVREDYLREPQEDTRAPTLVPLDEDASNVTTGRAPERPRRDTIPTGAVIVSDDPAATHDDPRPAEEATTTDGPDAGDFADGEESTTGKTLPLSDEDLEPGTGH